MGNASTWLGNDPTLPQVLLGIVVMLACLFIFAALVAAVFQVCSAACRHGDDGDPERHTRAPLIGSSRVRRQRTPRWWNWWQRRGARRQASADTQHTQPQYASLNTV